MSKETSSGILVKHGNRYILGHATGNNHFDIFKGRLEKGETLVQGAIRECWEESSLTFKEDDLTFLGKFEYTAKKNLAVFITKVNDISMGDLHCNTHFQNGNVEMDFYATFTFDELLLKVGKSMSKVLKELQKNIEEF